MTYLITIAATLATLLVYIAVRLWWALRHEWTDFEQPIKRGFYGER